MEVGRLREMAVRAALPARASLDAAVAALEFVQYDPIRSPGRAQDLILHQRVRGYRAGDLDRAYPRLGLDEGYLHVYGAMTRGLRRLLGPGGYRPSGLAADVLALVRRTGTGHPREVAARLGGGRVTNLWGGISAATTAALDELHRHWLVRVVRRDGGVKVYGPAPEPAPPPDPAESARRLTLYLARVLRPVPVASLRAALVQLRRRGGVAGALDELLDAGALVRTEVDGIGYLWPAAGCGPEGTVTRRVRLLAPFDPLVWDRRRFAHLWGWPYRFEAYTPAARRRYGYYALPMLLADRAIGWVECTVRAGTLGATAHFVDRHPHTRTFRTAFDTELDGLATMLGLRVGAVDR